MGCAVMVRAFGSCTVVRRWGLGVMAENEAGCLIDAGCMARTPEQALAWYVGIWWWP